ncbi:hypothetical protein MCM47_40595, partial [Kitasatospora sp. A2-31]|nr:hypothetical protein [Kitasatospora sp. A2-31]
TRNIAAVHEPVARRETPEQRIAAVVETFAARALRAPRLAHALLVEPADAVVDSERLVFRRAFRDVIAAEIAVALAAGRLPRQDPELTAAAIVGAVGEALAGPLAAAPAPPAHGRAPATAQDRAQAPAHGRAPATAPAPTAAPAPRDALPDVVPALVSFTLRALGGRDDSDA